MPDLSPSSPRDCTTPELRLPTVYMYDDKPKRYRINADTFSAIVVLMNEGLLRNDKLQLMSLYMSLILHHLGPGWLFIV